jgi:hypothetical protein
MSDPRPSCRGRRRGTRSAAVAAPLVVAILAMGCGPKPDPVAALVESLRAAAEGRDAQAISNRLTDDFRGSGGVDVDKAEAAATLRRYFAAYESVRLAVYDVAVTRRTETEAEVSFRVEFNGSARRVGGLDGFLPPSAVERFSLRLARRGPDWKVASAEWRPVEPIASPAP